MEELLKRIVTILEALDKERYTNTIRVEELKMKKIGYDQRNVMFEDCTNWETFRGGSHWGGKDTHCCFKTFITLPTEFSGKEVVASLQTGATDIWNTDNPQFLVYVDGLMTCAMDINHQEVILTEKAEAGKTYELGFYAYSNSEEPSIVMNIAVSAVHRDVEQLYYDIKVPYEVASLQRMDSLERIHTVQILSETINLIDLRKPGNESFYQSVAKAQSFLQNKYYEAECGTQDVTVHSIGHTHIDVAWKWPLRQTREKVIRSFKTVLYLMDHYPEYKFMSSQPQLYDFVKQDCPEVYEQIKKRVAQGRWETEGAMWLEADCNLTSGESLIRQILLGKQFFKEEFGKGENLILWLPDVFGYSAALPQIMKKSGIKYFMTTKIAWNEYNQIPNDVMMWKGIDGTEILTYFITTTNCDPYPELNRKPNISTTYNGRQNANQVMGTWQRFQNKNLLEDVLTCYGYGDGGGGPTAKMLEESRRMERGIPGCPQTKQTFAKDFFELIEKDLDGKKIPKWCGELYLEYHRGTYTSMARNKRDNRLCEFLNSDAELFSLMDMVTGGANSYPTKELKQVWELTLLNQFHDILPGSSIQDVYEDSEQQYKEALGISKQLIHGSLTSMMENHRTKDAEENTQNTDETSILCVWNQLGFSRDSVTEISVDEIDYDMSTDEIQILDHGIPLSTQLSADGKLLCLVKQIPSKGYRTFKLQKKSKAINDSLGEASLKKDMERIKVSKDKIDTPYYKIKLNAAGEFCSIYDIEAARELVQEGQVANQLIVFEDRPYEYDSWNIDSTYTEKYWVVSDLQSLTVTESGAVRTCIHIVRKFMESTINQDIILYPNSRRIDFKTTVDWKESQLLLKTAFPMDIVTEKATYEIQYGNVERPIHKNTSWDQAKFEVCAHKWADLAEDNYGVALMNDCKYGYDINESVMRLTLIKSGIFPNPVADQEIHHFTYSLLPHIGDFRKGRVIQEAYDLNCPSYVKAMTAENNIALGQPRTMLASDQTWSMLEADQENVMIDVIKKAESNDDIIIRMYEAYGRQSKVTITRSFFKDHPVWECDLMEQELEEKNFSVLEDSLSFTMKPYEIKTFRISKQ